MKRFPLIFLFFLNAINLSSQVIADTLLFEPFYNLVKKNHPVVKLAGLQLDRGSSAVMLAKGSFDPQAFSYLDKDRKSTRLNSSHT